MFGRFRLMAQILGTGRLALGLLRDSRVPMGAKLILGATAAYLILPIDLVPDVIPGLGQADDVLALLAGLNLFIRACPRWLVDEHERRLGGKQRQGMGYSGASNGQDPSNSAGPVIEGRYRQVR